MSLPVPKATVAELAAEARREVKERRRVYPRIVANERLTQELADRRIAMMVQIAELLESRCAENPQAAGLLL